MDVRRSFFVGVLLLVGGCTHETQLVVRAEWTGSQQHERVAAELHQVWKR